MTARALERVGVDAAIEQVFEPAIDRGLAKCVTDQRDERKRRQMSFIKHEGMAEWDRRFAVDVRIDDSKKRGRTRAVCLIPCQEGGTVDGSRQRDFHAAPFPVCAVVIPGRFNEQAALEQLPAELPGAWLL